MLYLACYILSMFSKALLLDTALLLHSGNTLAPILTAKFKYLDIHDVGHR